jgi:hypothetical protein
MRGPADAKIQHVVHGEIGTTSGRLTTIITHTSFTTANILFVASAVQSCCWIATLSRDHDDRDITNGRYANIKTQQKSPSTHTVGSFLLSFFIFSLSPPPFTFHLPQFFKISKYESGYYYYQEH